MSTHKTFSELDVIRIWANHLDEKEQDRILFFFWVIAPAFYAVDILVDIILARLLLILPAPLRFILTNALKRWFRELFKISDADLAVLMGPAVAELLFGGD